MVQLVFFRMGPDITFKHTKIPSACTVPGCWEHAEIPVCNTCTLQLRGISARQAWISPSWHWTPADQQPVLWKAFITNLPCIKDFDADEHEMLSFKLPHNSVLWAFTPPKLRVYSTSVTEPHRQFMQTCRLAWLCLSRLHAEVKNCRPSKNNDPYLQNKTGLTSSPTHRKKRNTSNEQPDLAKTLPYVVLASVYFPCWALRQKVVGWEGGNSI